MVKPVPPDGLFHTGMPMNWADAGAALPTVSATRIQVRFMSALRSGEYVCNPPNGRKSLPASQRVSPFRRQRPNDTPFRIHATRAMGSPIAKSKPPPGWEAGRRLANAGALHAEAQSDRNRYERRRAATRRDVHVLGFEVKTHGRHFHLQPCADAECELGLGLVKTDARYGDLHVIHAYAAQHVWRDAGRGLEVIDRGAHPADDFRISVGAVLVAGLSVIGFNPDADRSRREPDPGLPDESHLVDGLVIAHRHEQTTAYHDALRTEPAGAGDQRHHHEPPQCPLHGFPLQEW